MFLTVSQGIKEFCKNMVDNPHDWVQGHYEFINAKHPDIRVWTCNGAEYLKIGGNDGLTWAEKRHVMSAIKLTTARKIIA